MVETGAQRGCNIQKGWHLSRSSVGLFSKHMQLLHSRQGAGLNLSGVLPGKYHEEGRGGGVNNPLNRFMVWEN